MCDELKREIEEAKKSGRAERRKRERELQKKYNDKSIRIMSGKTFKKGEALNKKQKEK